VPAVVAGGLVALSVPPWGFWPLAFVGIGVLAWRLLGIERARARALVGLAFGLGLFAPTLFWISEFHAVGYVLLLLLESSFFAGAFALLPRAPMPRVVALPGAYVLAELVRGAVPFGGLPMGGLPLGQASGPLAPVARLGGELLLTGVAVAVGCALVAAARRQWRAAAPLIGIPIVLAAGGLVAPAGHAVARQDVTIVQGGGPRGYHAVDTDPRDVLDRHLAVSEGIRRPVDLVLWPENTIDVSVLEGTEEEAALSRVARTTDATVIAGVTEDVGFDNFQNVAVAWAPDGKIVDRYIKVHRVPFGEYVPLRGVLEHVVDLRVLPRDAVAGKGAGVLQTPAGEYAVAISYEVFFAGRARSAMRAGGQALLVPTNAASFTTSQVPTQEVAAAQLRAWETGRWVVMSAPTGYGAVIDADARVLDRTTLSRAQLLRGEIELRDGRTPYVALGDLPVLLLALMLVVGAWWWVRRSSASGPEAPAVP
jgi:apolipoprotein N-acyltransferase